LQSIALIASGDFYSMAQLPTVGQDLTITRIVHTTLGMTPLDEWSARRTDLYL